MSGSERSPAQETLELPGLEAGRPLGRVEAAVRQAIAAAPLLAVDAGAAEAAAGLGRGMDLALGRQDPYAVAAVGKPLMEQLGRLGMDPSARGEGDTPSDPWDKLVDQLAGELKGGQRAHAPGPAH